MKLREGSELGAAQETNRLLRDLLDAQLRTNALLAELARPVTSNPSQRAYAADLAAIDARMSAS